MFETYLENNFIINNLDNNNNKIINNQNLENDKGQ